MTPDDHAGLLGRLERRAGHLGVGAYSFALCLVTLGVCGLVGLLVKEPYLFPSLGPTVMLLFEGPDKPPASARNVLVGHLVAISVGAACLYGFGLGDDPSAFQASLTPSRVAAGALSVALTALVLRALRSPHAPAGATTLIVSLGVLKTPTQLATMLLAVVVVTVVAVSANRLLGVHHPLLPQPEAGDP